jgi:hypothetical protein
VVVNPAAATSLAEWRTIPYATTDLLVLPINSPQDLLTIPGELIQGRFHVRAAWRAGPPALLGCRPRLASFSATHTLAHAHPAPPQLHCCLESLSPTPRISEATLPRPSTRAKAAAQGVSWVLRSLTSSHKSVLAKVLAGVKAGKPHTVDSLLKLCKQGMVVRNAVELRGVVTELTDHGIIAQQSGVFTLKASAAEVEAALKEGGTSGEGRVGGAGEGGGGGGKAGGGAGGGGGGRSREGGWGRQGRGQEGGAEGAERS